MLNKHKFLSGLTTLSLATSLFVTPAFAQSASVAPSVSPSPSATATPNPGTSNVRFVHASPDAPAVDLYVDDKRLLAGNSYKNISRYLSISAGRHTFKLYPTSAKGSGTPVISAELDLNKGWDYTIAASGKLANIQAKVFSDNLNIPTSGKSKVRVYHLAPNAPAINIAQKGGDTIVRGLSFPNATEYQEVDSKVYNLEVQNAQDNKVLLSIPSTNLTKNSVSSVFAFGLVNETPALSVVTTVDRRAITTPATGAEENFGFMALVAVMIATTGIIIKKIALVQEQN
ncbi:MAG: DUF4397 domain-containing protein [bacterium]|nr:DUF4397 domain-containing protein [bacterium]